MVKKERYWRLPVGVTCRDSERDVVARLRELLTDAVDSHLMSDVPLGAFLSGGIDSSLIVALMSRRCREPVKTFTIGFGGWIGGHLDERPYAKLLSDHYHTAHTEFVVQPDLDETLDAVLEAFDEPIADDSVVPSYHICELAREHVTVALTGLGGDELLGGYERHLGYAWSAMYNGLPESIRRRVLLPLINRLPERKDAHSSIDHLKRFARAAELPESDRYRDYSTVFSESLRRGVLVPDVVARPTAHGCPGWFQENASWPSRLQEALHHDIHTSLTDDFLALTDRLSMRVGLELRVPFLDHPVVEYCATIPDRLKIRFLSKKYVLKQVAKDFLPPPILSRRKQGFGSPMGAWLRNDLKGYVASALSRKRLARHGLFRFEAVQDLIQAHLSRKGSYDRQIFAILMFQKWYERRM